MLNNKQWCIQQFTFNHSLWVTLPNREVNSPNMTAPGSPRGRARSPRSAFPNLPPAHRTSHGATPAPNQQKAEPQREGVGREKNAQKLLVLSLRLAYLKGEPEPIRLKTDFSVDPFPAPTHHESTQLQALGQDDKTPSGCNKDLKANMHHKNAPYVTL